MKGVSGRGLVALAVAALLGSLTLVTWRQTRALEALRALEAAESDVSLAVSERDELVRRIQRLESRAYIVAEAERRLDMHTPEAAEIVYVTGVEP